MAITLDDMAELARALLNADDVVKVRENDLKHAKEEARVLREETIPMAMEELGLKSIELDSGQKLTVTEEVYASIPKGDQHKAFAWLNEHGFGGLIKIKVEQQYGKGEQEQALAFYSELVEKGMSPKFSETVHPQTLKAFIKEQLADGNNVPLDIFGARPIMTAKIK